MKQQTRTTDEWRMEMERKREGEEKKMKRKRAKEEKVEQKMIPRRAKVESLRGRRLRRAGGKRRIGEGTGGLGSLLPDAEIQTEQTAEGTGG